MKNFVVGVILCYSGIFGWNLSGQVVSESGEGLSGVTVSSFNYAGISTMSDLEGYFSISDDPSVLFNSKVSAMSVEYDGKTVIFQNVHALSFKVSLLDALGKVAFEKDLDGVSGNLYFDLSNLPRKWNFLCVKMDNRKDVYSLDKKGILKKVGDPLALLYFSKDGYESATYQMTSENETGVQIAMKLAGSEPIVSSSAIGNSSSSNFSSSSTVLSSASDEPVDCSGKTLESNTNLMIDGRKIVVKFPSGYTGKEPVPLLVNYHPIGGSADNWANSSQIAQSALAEGAIVVFPDGEQSPNFGQAWNVGPCCTDADDVTFTKHFLEELKEKACVDPKRVYAAGFSMGGGFSNYAGCFLSEYFAAAAPSAFDLSEEIVNAGKCSPARAFPILNFRGTNDNVVQYDGGYSSLVTGKPITFLGARKNFKKWAELNGCSGSPVDKGNGCEYYEHCRDGVKVGLCTIQNGGHSEGDGKTGWDFVKQFRLP
ncbi:alpha/beta hydrolase-fold protein [uncultured Fibrobacter sp.]|uniref:alpha/beta hydrolase-fold protein n=1 Tax=uncultured Fibrobacter sp. TaxID=261512 RepID=UPI002805EED7|nr:PHB depolymerase family esterase [uncultured Fibrobacter sp.]